MKQSFFNFKKPIIENLSYKLRSDFDEKEHESISVSINASKSITRCNNDSRAKVTLELDFDEETFPFIINISMSTEVEWINNNEEHDEELIKSILETNVPSLLLSYIRPIVTQLTANSPYIPFDIPFLDLRNQGTKT